MKKNLSIITLLIAALSYSCKKSEVSPNEQLQDGKSIVVADLAGDTEASLTDGTPGRTKRPFYSFLFRLKDQKQIWLRNQADTAQYLNTAEWDIAFSGNYNSEISARGTIVKVDTDYNLVNEAPSDQTFAQSTITKVGWAASSDSPGWYNYSLSSHIMQRIKNRTYIIKLNSGKYAKLELINIYKGNPPAVTDLYWPTPYLTFRYFVQEDGSKNLRTK